MNNPSPVRESRSLYLPIRVRWIGVAYASQVLAATCTPAVKNGSRRLVCASLMTFPRTCGQPSIASSKQQSNCLNSKIGTWSAEQGVIE